MKLKYLVLGRNNRKTDNGFVYDEIDGNWTLYKCFYEQDGKYGEFFFNTNYITHEAEISYKNLDYAKDLIEAFSKEMLGGEEKYQEYIGKRIDADIKSEKENFETCAECGEEIPEADLKEHYCKVE